MTSAATSVVKESNGNAEEQLQNGVEQIDLNGKNEREEDDDDDDEDDAPANGGSSAGEASSGWS